MTKCIAEKLNFTCRQIWTPSKLWQVIASHYEVHASPSKMESQVIASFQMWLCLAKALTAWQPYLSQTTEQTCIHITSTKEYYMYVGLNARINCNESSPVKGDLISVYEVSCNLVPCNITWSHCMLPSATDSFDRADFPFFLAVQNQFEASCSVTKCNECFGQLALQTAKLLQVDLHWTHLAYPLIWHWYDTWCDNTYIINQSNCMCNCLNYSHTTGSYYVQS